MTVYVLTDYRGEIIGIYDTWEKADEAYEHYENSCMYEPSAITKWEVE